MRAEELLREISDYCRSAGLAESTFGRAAINDGKLVSRLRNGGRITTDTLDKIRGFMAARPAPLEARQAVVARLPWGRPEAPLIGNGADSADAGARGHDPKRNFRFFDNRQKYLLFVNTCSEKWDVANRVSQELANIHPRPPSVRVFDAGVGDGTILSRVMRAMHDR
ncbi:MAG TPA: hypothetical protein VND97_02670, partial [Beijerinckiaceae bacterium]|nr:hypothetical protein [Beijerinckiaceae bacterium]